MFTSLRAPYFVSGADGIRLEWGRDRGGVTEFSTCSPTVGGRFCRPKLAEGERRTVDLTGIVPAGVGAEGPTPRA